MAAELRSNVDGLYLIRSTFTGSLGTGPEKFIVPVIQLGGGTVTI
jgi:hypothetical protein